MLNKSVSQKTSYYQLVLLFVWQLLTVDLNKCSKSYLNQDLKMYLSDELQCTSWQLYDPSGVVLCKDLN